MVQSNFHLLTLGKSLETLREDLLNGKGFILFKGLPVLQWGNHKSAVAYMGLGTYLGYFVSQNSRGHVLGHVKDLVEDSTKIDKVRIYRTNARYVSPCGYDSPFFFPSPSMCVYSKYNNNDNNNNNNNNMGKLNRQFFHSDDSDIVGLLCIARALEGGESDIASSHNIYNVLAQERPDVLKTLTEPIWYFDRKGETSKGEEEYIRTSVMYLESKGDNPRVYTKYVFLPSVVSFFFFLFFLLSTEKRNEAMKRESRNEEEKDHACMLTSHRQDGTHTTSAP
jgi:hypothetical protein